MNESQITVAALIVIAVGIFVGSRIWMMFRRWRKEDYSVTNMPSKDYD